MVPGPDERVLPVQEHCFLRHAQLLSAIFLKPPQVHQPAPLRVIIRRHKVQTVFNFAIKRVHHAIRTEHSKADDELAVSHRTRTKVQTGAGEHKPTRHVRDRRGNKIQGHAAYVQERVSGEYAGKVVREVDKEEDFAVLDFRDIKEIPLAIWQPVRARENLLLYQQRAHGRITHPVQECLAFSKCVPYQSRVLLGPVKSLRVQVHQKRLLVDQDVLWPIRL
jgi:hypothetical protein